MQAEHGEFQTDYESFCGMFKLFQLKDQEHDQVPSRRVGHIDDTRRKLWFVTMD